MMRKLKLYSILTLIGAVLIVVIQNTQVVETRLLFFSVIMPRAALLGITLLIGVFIGFMGGLIMADQKTKPKQ